MYARDLIHQGYIGEVLTANLSVISDQALRARRRPDLAGRTNGANTLTMPGGTPSTALLRPGEFDELAARVTTRIKEWQNTETGQDVPVDSPDWISVAGACSRAPRCRCWSRPCRSTPAARAWRSTAATGRW